MKRPSFFEGVVVALIASTVAGVGFWVLSSMSPNDWALRVLIITIDFAYILYLLQRSPERIGRVTIMAAWISIAVLLWVIQIPLLFFLVAHIALVWLIRSLYFHTSLISALLDFLLCGTSLVVAIGAGLQSESLFLSIWCFFLIQACFVTIPSNWKQSFSVRNITYSKENRFDYAYRSAEAAVRKLASLTH